MLETTQQMIQRAGKKLGIDEKTINLLLKTNAEHEFQIKLEGGKQFSAYRVQHNNSRGPYKGGVRFHRDVNLEEVRGLATLMSLKTAAVNIPFGGGKGGVAVDPKKLSTAELEELSRLYVQNLQTYIGPDKDIPAPDVNTNSQIIDWMVDEYSLLTGDESRASFTGKSVARGGILGREGATGRGGVVALSELLINQNKKEEPLTYAIQGFGNVGSFFATVAAKDHPNWKLIAASDSADTLYCQEGLDADKLARYKATIGKFSDYPDNEIEHIYNNDLLSLKVDILVLAALGDVIDENNADQVNASYIVELANGPVNTKAHDILTAKGVTILPDIIANAGGVIVSYLEWLQNNSNERWTEQEVNKKLTNYMSEAMRDLLETVKQTESNSLTETAFILALRRLIDTNKA